VEDGVEGGVQGGVQGRGEIANNCEYEEVLVFKSKSENRDVTTYLTCAGKRVILSIKEYFILG
jgi:hypothetical protein